MVPVKGRMVFPRIFAYGLYLAFSVVAFAQDHSSSLPADLLRPQYGETPRFPRDYWIGELGRGEAGEDAYRSARQVAAALLDGTENAGLSQRVQTMAAELRGMNIRSVRIGGGRNEADGSVSFLVRFLGREEALTGELFLRKLESAEEAGPGQTGPPVWQLDDFIVDGKRSLGEGPYGPGMADMSVYESFF
jgi:hypothetical protein